MERGIGQQHCRNRDETGRVYEGAAHVELLHPRYRDGRTHVVERCSSRISSLHQRRSQRRDLLGVVLRYGSGDRLQPLRSDLVGGQEEFGQPRPVNDRPRDGQRSPDANAVGGEAQRPDHVIPRHNSCGDCLAADVADLVKAQVQDAQVIVVTAAVMSAAAQRGGDRLGPVIPQVIVRELQNG